MMMMMRPKHIYIAGVKYPDPTGLQWTAAEIDAAYLYLCNLRGDFNAPPNKWYPLNILGFSNYSITRSGLVRNNKLNRLLEGTLHESTKWKFKMTNDKGEKKEKYVARLVVTMFNSPPTKPFSVVCYRDGQPQNCDASNLYWASEETKTQTAGTPSAKLVRLKSVPTNETNQSESDTPNVAATALIQQMTEAMTGWKPRSMFDVPFVEPFPSTEQQQKDAEFFEGGCIRSKAKADEKDSKWWILNQDCQHHILFECDVRSSINMKFLMMLFVTWNLIICPFPVDLTSRSAISLQAYEMRYVMGTEAEWSSVFGGTLPQTCTLHARSLHWLILFGCFHSFCHKKKVPSGLAVWRPKCGECSQNDFRFLEWLLRALHSNTVAFPIKLLGLGSDEGNKSQP